ncbi:hypothetical protein QQS21_010028 [Conoideocrella luteorostrata]|uniref:RCC1-like domain-containing protein n=1 Tax=Conoideocrella luteorostrata TaxID=1105319 RepID=A0AAJ0FX99_9HYPO|nr:hypothetical protein QQS21_010028 [Conoideocrella luteorostrata]
MVTSGTAKPQPPVTHSTGWGFRRVQHSLRKEISKFFTPSSKRKREEGDVLDTAQDVAVETANSLGGAKRRKLTDASTRSLCTARSVRATAHVNGAPTQRLDVIVFGSGDDGELGLGHIRYDRKNPAVADKPRLNHFLDANDVGVVQVAVGAKHCAALTHDGRVLTWGANDSRALGRNTIWEKTKESDKDMTDLNPMESLPAPAEGLANLKSGIAQVAATENATFILTNSGLVYGWGTFLASDGVYGFLREKMRVKERKKKTKPSYEARFQKTPIQIEGLKNVKALSAGTNHMLALTQSGDVYAWGSGQQGQLGRRLVQRHQFESLMPRMVDLPRRGIVKIFAGFNHSFAVDKQGRVWTWGLNNFGQTGIPANEENLHIGIPTIIEGLKGCKIRHMAGGLHHSLACTEDEQVLAWGRCDDSQMGMDISALPNEMFLFDSRGKRRILLQPTVIPGTSATFVAAGIDNSLCIDAEGTVVSWGFSENFRTGLGTQKTIETPRELISKGVVNRAFTFAGCGGQFSVITRPHE